MLYNLFFCTDKNMLDLLPFIFNTFLKFNNPEKFIIHFILYDEKKTIHNIVLNELNKLSDKFNIKYKYFVPPEDLKKLIFDYELLLRKKTDFNENSIYFNFSNWSRFYISELFPNVKYGLYLDMDILFNKSIAKFIKRIDMKNYIIGAVPYDNYISYNIKKLCFKTNEDIKKFRKILIDLNIDENKLDTNFSYNCGVLYFNFKLFKKNNILSKIFNILNYCIDNKVIIFRSGTEKSQNIIIPEYKKIDQKYNFIVNEKKNTLNKYLKKISIIHFKGLKNLINNKIYLDKYNYILNR